MVETEDGEHEDIQTRPEIVVDGDLSDKKIEALLKLGHEEERLDYKTSLDFSTSRAKNRSKVDLVCDIVSMANTDGGYILVGADDKGRLLGTSQSCVSCLKQATIQQMVEPYVDATIRIASRDASLSGKAAVVICVFPHLLPVPFRRDGQYSPEKGRVERKFLSGDTFVRRGEHSVKANYEDLRRLMERVRSDERVKTFSTISERTDIVSRLDAILNLMGGAAPPFGTLDLLAGSESDAERRMIQMLDPRNPTPLLRDQFDRVLEFLEQQQHTETVEELEENLNRTFVGFLGRIIAVWSAGMDCDAENLARFLAEELRGLYMNVSGFNYKSAKDGDHPLWLQTRIVCTVYCLGALTIARDKPRFARAVLCQWARFGERQEIEPLFRQIISLINREARISDNLCGLAKDFAVANTYVLKLFKDEDSLLDSLCQFDFLQCAYVLATGGGAPYDCVPNFGRLWKERTEPMVRRIVESHDKGVWIPETDASSWAGFLRQLEGCANDLFRVYSGWRRRSWRDPIIASFLERNSGEQVP